MKKLLLLLSLFVLTSAIAQEEEVNGAMQSSIYNKWSIDINGGLSRPTTPFLPGYYVEDLSFFHVDLGARYMFNPKFGMKMDFGYDSFENPKDVLAFKSQYYRVNLQGVLNVGRALNFEEFTQSFNIQAHGGLGYSFMTSNNFDGEDNMANVLIGLTGQYKLSEKVALNADFTMINNIRQHYTFDGASGFGNLPDDRGFNGTLYNATLGLSIYLGSNDMHADWAYEMQDERQAEMEDRMAEIETMMNDTDRDGVPDYLDVENNTTNGVAVDAKGRAIDLNNNGIPDELERYVEAKTKEAVAVSNGTNGSSGGRANKSPLELINQGYINIFFDTDSFDPKSSSTNDLYFVINYLRDNPSASAEIIGTADTRGTNEYNQKLSAKRAERVKSIVEKAGIDGSRMTIVPQGEANLGDGSANLSLVRKVTFKIK
ncbi:OmpA family protein [uncultured Flavobacterium sp.]|uniref:OmpA family protein n=1 Tax=uncultured Flavobacterium sp. TaxID=165435 RepID=UPI0030ED1D64|tara:strand:+ start:61371 stop:62657 length:1287 start_codon:yes stop_codon:yes gene_type:complete